MYKISTVAAHQVVVQLLYKIYTVVAYEVVQLLYKIFRVAAHEVVKLL